MMFFRQPDAFHPYIFGRYNLGTMSAVPALILLQLALDSTTIDPFPLFPLLHEERLQILLDDFSIDIASWTISAATPARNNKLT